ncbi:ABC transporter substrate-binding protein [Rhizobium sullae]|uniref:ABC transporter substrate-binding protein n=1 Tax=Rhizobium sullae TaxID=50338 RepID=A0A2N0DEE4_RHISU|nr:TRAP transporter substrate-binding protein [Rhizobium sullae]PKA44471.1 ABC transporter substrate-binding protein [Rhizobium sullae]
MKTFKVSLLGSLFALATTLPVLADELILSSWLPPRHPIVENAIKPWAEEISKATEGRVTIRVLAKPLGSPPSHFDMARDGVADITYGLHSFTEDNRFKNARIGQFSFLGDDPVSNSEAFWSIYTQQLGAEKEHQGTHVLGLFMHGPGMLHNNKKPVGAVEDLNGLKIRVPGGYVADLLKGFGVEPLFMSSGEVYEKLSRGVVDGVAFPYDAIASFKLADSLKYTTKLPGGVYNTTWFLVMNQAKWDAISPEDQAKLTGLSGLAFAKRVGGAWRGADEAGAAAAEAGKLEVSDASPALVDAIRARATELEAAWADSLDAGYDGRAALAAFRQSTGLAQ